MPVSLYVQVLPGALHEKKVIEFYSSGEWTQESEELLILRTQEVIAAIRPYGKTLHLDLNVEVTDAVRATNIVKVKLNDRCAVNHHKLSLREIEVLGLIMLGYTNKDIGEKLFISYETVKSHRKNILAKSGAKNTAALVNFYHQTFFEK